MIVARNTRSGARTTVRAAFTLMEVMVVVAILVILASVGSVAVFKYMDDAKESTAKLGISKIETAVVAYRTKHGSFPTNLEQLTVVEGTSGAYLETGDLRDPWGNEFGYNPQELHPQSQKPKIYVTQPPNPNNPISNW